MARTMKNLKIRKFLTMQGYKNAEIGEDDLCIVLNGDQPLIQVTEMPTADAGELDKVYQYIGSGGQYNYGWFYRCFYNSNNNQYYWGSINVQESATPYSTSAIGSNYLGSFNGLRIPAFRFRDNMFSQTYRDTFGILVKIVNTDTGDVFYGKAESFGGVRKCRTYAATGIFSEVRFSFYKTSSSSSIHHFGLIKPDGSMIDSNGGNYYYSIQAYGSWSYAESELYPQAVNYNYYDVLVFDELPDTTVNGQTGNVIITPSSIGAVPQYSVMPSVLDVSVGTIVQYIGATDATYTNGYFYKNNAVITPSSATISQTSGSGLSDITIDKEVFESMAQPSTGSYVFSYSIYEQITPSEATNWDVTIKILNQATFIADIKQEILSQTGSDAFEQVGVNCSRVDMSSPTLFSINILQNGTWYSRDIIPEDWGLSVTGEFSGSGSGSYTILNGYYSSSDSWVLSGSPVNISYYGIAYTGTETIGDELTVAYTAVSYTGGWDQTDVQPSSGGSSYTAGNGISIDANNEISVTAPTLQNGGTGTDALAINTTGRFSTTVAIGKGAGGGGGSYWLQGVLIGNNADCTCAGAVAIGYGAKAGNGSDVGEGSVAIGSGATVTRNTGVSPRAYGIAIGKSAQATETAIQIGTGTNNDVDTVKIANRNGNFEIMNANGNLPADRLASTTGLADGNYRLRCTITNGVPTLTWVAE